MAYTGRPVRQLATLTSAQIADKAVATVDIADAAITAAKVGANALTANTFGAKSVGTAAIADAAITAAKISPNTLAANTYGTKSIAGAAIADGAVSSVKIASGTINANNIATLTANVTFADSARAIFGTGSDLEIYHDGSNSRINDAGTGNLQLQLGGSTKLAVTSTGATVTGRAYGTLTTDNDGSFDLTAANNFKCTPTGDFTLTFTNMTSGQSGMIILINTGGHTVSAAGTTKVSATALGTISVAGTYVLSYISDGTNAYVVNSGALS
jgi:hypothetical protein